MNELLSLQDLFNKKIFRIPDYQRGYSWTELQLEEFWNDILDLLPNREHYTGMISLKEVEINDTRDWQNEKWLLENWGYKAYHVVDGQQRLTTFIILINEIINFYKKNNKDKDLDKIFINSLPLTKIVEDYMVISKPDSAGVIKSFKFGYEVDNPSYEFFKCKILEEEFPGDINETFYTLNLEHAKEFFKENIKNLVNENGIEKLEEVFKKITLKLKFNMYYIENDFNVFIAFETMNNRGKKLSNLELLKNRLIYLSTVFNVSTDIQETVRKNINETWKTVYGRLGKNKVKPLNDDEFLNAHWIIYFGYTRSYNVTYNSFLLKDYFHQKNINVNKSIKETDEDNEFVPIEDEEDFQGADIKVNSKKHVLKIEHINNYVNSMKNIIPYWYQIHYPEEINNKKIKMYIEKLNRLGYANFKPLVCVLLSKKDVSDELKILCLKKIERFIFLHYRLNNYAGTYKNSFFFNMAHDFYIQEVNIEEILKNVSEINYLSENKVITSDGIFDKFDKKFKNSEGFYNWATLRYVLYEYERYLMGNGANVRLLPEDIFKVDEKDFYSIEHVYPQTPKDEEWVFNFRNHSNDEKKRLTNTLGNLLPLSKSVNSILQNKPFNEKKEKRFCDGSHNELEVSRYVKWTASEILDRGLKIIEFMENEWDFIMPSLKDRKRILGLNFLINEGDELIDRTDPIIKADAPYENRAAFSDEEYNKLVSGTPENLLEKFNEINNYIMSLGDDIEKNSTSVYISYTNGKNFAEFRFLSTSITAMIMTGIYDDPNKLITVLPENYNWVNKNKIIITIDSDLAYIKGILKQSYEKTL